jgi:glycosyltransferase involved in cell wall biosynthesis
MPEPNILVLQPGARLHYAAPAALARAGLLRRLYTDIHSERALLRFADQFVPGRLKPILVKRILGRKLPAEIHPRMVKDYPLWALTGRRGKLGKGLTIDQVICRDVAKDARNGDVVYTVLINSDLDTLRVLKRRGVKIVHECIIGPDVGLWLRDERSMFPGLERDDTNVEEGRARDREKYQLADLILAPSNFTRDAILALGAHPEKIKVVPYGIDEKWLAVRSTPEPGRVLFVGSVGLRKGTHYLAAAVRLLRDEALEFRVIGPAPSELTTASVFQGPKYVGQVPRSQIVEEYRRADVLVLPTICDSFALVHLEALACGVPVVTTPNCGSVVRDGLDGFIVPIRNPPALAEAISWIVKNRALRARMSVNAKQRAGEYILPRYQDRLIDALTPVIPRLADHGLG